MKSTIYLFAVLALILAALLTAAPAQAVSGSAMCMSDPATGPVGTVFAISCAGFSPNTILNMYGVEPSGRASGLNIYGFLPSSAKTDGTGTANFKFVTEIPGFTAVPPGDYIIVVHELSIGGGVAAEVHLPITVQSAQHPLVGALLAATFDKSDSDHVLWYTVDGMGYVPGEAVNIWVTQPPAAQCGGLGIDQLTLGNLAGNGSSLWTAPGTVWADKFGNIEFSIGFRTSACRGEHIVSARSPSSHIGGQVSIVVTGFSVPAANAQVTVNPGQVPAWKSFHVVSGTGFPANTGVNCWYTRPDGRSLFFIAFNAKTDNTGSFAAGSSLDDFPPYTSTIPGTWWVTCATPNQSVLGETSFQVFALMSDP